VAEIILGIGQLKNVGNLLVTFEDQIKKFQGAPKRLLAEAEGFTIVAERPEFEGEFETVVMRVQADPATAEALRARALDCADSCTVSEEDGWQVIHCPPAGAAASDLTKEALEKLSDALVLPPVWRILGEEFCSDILNIELLFQAIVQYKATDVHLSTGQTPIFRVDGQAHHSEMMEPLAAGQILRFVREIAPAEYWTEFEENKQTTFSYHQLGIGRARVSAFIKAGAPHCTLRFLPETIPSFEELTLPKDTMINLAQTHRGLVLIAGMSGSGKTTTSAALIDWINTNTTSHILTIEDPVEYVHFTKNSVISQRSVGDDVNSFSDAITGAIRHDPDVVFLGEMNDRKTIRAAIDAASTGRLVISTLNSNTASETVGRIASFFDPSERDLIKMQLRDCLRGVICQRLVPRIGGGRVAALEILLNDIKPLAAAIVEGNTDGIRIGMQQTVSHSFLFEEYLFRLYKSEVIDLDQAVQFSTDRSIFDQMRMGTYSVPRLESLKAARDASSRS